MIKIGIKNSKGHFALIDITICIVTFVLAASILHNSVVSTGNNLDILETTMLMDRTEITLHVFLRTTINSDENGDSITHLKHISEIIAEALYFKNSFDFDIPLSLRMRMSSILTNLTWPYFDYTFCAEMNEKNIKLASERSCGFSDLDRPEADAEKEIRFNFQNNPGIICFKLVLGRL